MADDGSPVERRARGTLNRALALETAAILFNRKGYDRTSMNDIAAALQITKPALYHYFRSKEDILLAAVDRAAQLFESARAELAPTHSSPVVRIESFLWIYAQTLAQPIFRSVAMADERVLDEPGRHTLRACKRRLQMELEQLVRAAVKEGEIEPLDARATVQALFGVFNWAAVSLGDDDIAASLEALMAVVRRMLRRGLLPAA